MLCFSAQEKKLLLPFEFFRNGEKENMLRFVKPKENI